MSIPDSFYIIAIIGLVALLLESPKILRKRRATQEWEKASGKITKRVSLGLGRRYSKYFFTYNFRGKTYEAKLVYKFWPIKILKKGDTVTLLVNPNKPAQVFFDPPFDFFEKLSYWIFGWLLTIILISIILSA